MAKSRPIVSVAAIFRPIWIFVAAFFLGHDAPNMSYALSVGTTMILSDYATSYLLSRDVCADYARLIRTYIARLDSWLGHPATIDLDADTINRWLIHVSASGLAPKTVRGHRQAVITLLRAAEEDGLRGPLGRVRRPKVPRKPPVAWSVDEVRRLLEACKGIHGFCSRTGCQRSTLLEATFRLCWDSGARIGDVLRFRWDDLYDDGRLVWTQHKTGVPHRARLSASTMDALQRLHAGRDRHSLLIPWIDLDTCFRWIKKAVDAAGLKGGTKKIRRGAASEAERRQPGSGWRLLGHTAPGLDRQFYLDPHIAYQECVTPPEL